MPGATGDSFARFMDLLAQTLDDSEVSGDVFAARLHLSRFHLDRLISAAVGEPPATLRAWIFCCAWSNTTSGWSRRCSAARRPCRRRSSISLSRYRSTTSTPTPPCARCSRAWSAIRMWNAAVPDRPYDFGVERNETVDHMRGRLTTSGPAFLAQVGATVEEGRLDETFVDAICDPPEVFTHGGMIAHVLTFAAHPGPWSAVR